MKNTIIIIALVAIFCVAAYFVVVSNLYKPAPSQLVPGSAATAPVAPAASGTAPSPVMPSADTATNGAINPSIAANTVFIKNFSFYPALLNVKVGTKVTWINNDSVVHTVTSDSDILLNSGDIAPGQSFSFTFTKPGSSAYHCSIHPTMNGAVLVK